VHVSRLRSSLGMQEFNTYPPRSATTSHAVALMVTILCTVSACTGGERTNSRSGQRVPASSVRPASYDEFGFGLLRQLTASAPGRNAIVSPVSAGLALALALDGASGSTRDSLAAVLGFAGLTPAKVADRNAALIAELRSAPEVTLTVSNALWGRSDVRFDASFLRSAHDDYGADIASLDLHTPEAVARINTWVDSATRGKISQVLTEPLPDNTALLLTNAVYFKGSWATRFDAVATKPRPFHLGDGSIAMRPLMALTGNLAYASGDGFELLRLPYRGRRLVMDILLPDSGRTVDEVMAHLTAGKFGSVIARAAPRPVALALPRVTLQCSADLSRDVSALGAANAFDRDRAEFGRMLEPSGAVGGTRTDASRRVWLDRVLQRTVVEVNEEGTVAAAATAVESAVDSMPPPPTPFVVDRPFLFAIRDDATAALLFVGVVDDPAGACSDLGVRPYSVPGCCPYGRTRHGISFSRRRRSNAVLHLRR
jgi:serine protease inhibitor